MEVSSVTHILQMGNGAGERSSPLLYDQKGSAGALRLCRQSGAGPGSPPPPRPSLGRGGHHFEGRACSGRKCVPGTDGLFPLPGPGGLRHAGLAFDNLDEPVTLTGSAWPWSDPPEGDLWAGLREDVRRRGAVGARPGSRALDSVPAPSSIPSVPLGRPPPCLGLIFSFMERGVGLGACLRDSCFLPRSRKM